MDRHHAAEVFEVDVFVAGRQRDCPEMRVEGQAAVVAAAALNPVFPVGPTDENHPASVATVPEGPQRDSDFPEMGAIEATKAEFEDVS